MLRRRTGHPVLDNLQVLDNRGALGNLHAPSGRRMPRRRRMLRRGTGHPVLNNLQVLGNLGAATSTAPP